jgi:gamma-glutamyltranspeptidase/glutathione hydrolase
MALLRIHHQWQPDQVMVEPPGFNAKTEQALTAKGHKIQVKDLGCKVQAIEKQSQMINDKVETRLIGISDYRGEGLALGFMFND